MAAVARVLIADDHALYLEGLREIIERWDDFTVVGEAQNGAEALELCRLRHPDLVLMDLKMPVMDGITALSHIHREMPSVAVVMLSVYESEDDVIASIRAGARGYVLKDCYARQLHHRLRSVMEGECTLSDKGASRCFDYIRNAGREPLVEGAAVDKGTDMLTDHDRRILSLIAIGASNKEIGERLYISESTVKKQISSLLTKLDLDNRVQAAVFALRSGIAS